MVWFGVPLMLRKLCPLLRIRIPVIVGADVGTTITVKVHLDVLPCASIAVLVTVVVPTAKLLPLAGLLLTVTPGQLSVAVTLKVTLLLAAPGAALTVRFAGHVICGG